MPEKVDTLSEFMLRLERRVDELDAALLEVEAKLEELLNGT